MRRQNPPQAYLENAEYLERYLRPSVIYGIYAIAGILCIAVVALCFALLIRNQNLAYTQTTFAALAALVCLPVVAVLLLCFLRPKDPVSAWLMWGSETWRKPLPLHREECAFKDLLGSGDTLSLKLAVFYPVRDDGEEIQQRLHIYLKAALAKDCSMLLASPGVREIEEIVEPVLEVVASERGIPVLYCEVVDLETIRADYSVEDGELEVAEIWRTGT